MGKTTSNPCPERPAKHPPPYTIRFTWEQREELNRLTEGEPWAPFIKQVVFSKEFLPPTPKVTPIQDKKLLARLLGTIGKSRIAANINQLAKAANSGSLPVSEDVSKSIMEACQAIFWIRDTLINAMGMKPQRHINKEEDHAP